MLDFKDYKTKDRIVEATLFHDTDDVGELVQQLYDVGCTQITVVIHKVNPQLEESTLLTSISLVQNGVAQTIFEFDYVVFDDDDNVVVLSPLDFDREYEEV